MLRYCSRCKTDKPEIEFMTKTGRRYVYCRECTMDYQRNYQFLKHDAERVHSCEICSADITGKRKAHWDHNHETGEFRGWLCVRCNLLLGYADDDVDLLDKAIVYLTQRGGKCRNVNADEHSSTASTVDTQDSSDKQSSLDKSTE